MCGLFREGVAVKYGRIDELRQQHPVAAMCRVLDVSESGYHAWRKRPPSPRAQENARLEVEIKAAHQRTRQTYGPERLQADLADHGVKVGVHRIKRIRKNLKRALQTEAEFQGDHRFKATTDSKHTLPVAPNLLDRQFAVTVPTKAWVTDITYVAIAEGWLYLGGVKDLITGELVGYDLAERMTQRLVMRALFRTVTTQRPGKGLVHTRIAEANTALMPTREYSGNSACNPR